MDFDYDALIQQQRDRLSGLQGIKIFRGEVRPVVPTYLMPDPSNERYPGEVLKQLRRGNLYPIKDAIRGRGPRTGLDNASIGTHWSTNFSVSKDNFAYANGNQRGVPASPRDLRKMKRGWDSHRSNPDDLPDHWKGDNIVYPSDRLTGSSGYADPSAYDARPFSGRFIWHGTIDNPEEQVDPNSLWTPYEKEINLKPGSRINIHAVHYAVAPSDTPHYSTNFNTIQFDEPIQMRIGRRN